MARDQADTLIGYIRRLAASQAMTAMSDGELVGRLVADSDQCALEFLVRRHGPMVFGVCRRILGNPENAEDAFQATFLLLMQKVGSLRRQGSVSCWLYGVAARVARRARAAAARRRAHESRAAARPLPDMAAEITLREAQQAFDSELTRLPEKYRAPLILCCLEGKTRDEAARELHCSLNTLKSRLEQGRDLLRRGLAKSGLPVPATMASELLVGGRSHAALPVGLVRSTIRLANGSIANAAIPAKILSLAEGVSIAMMVTKIKVGALLLLVVGLLAGGGVFAARQIAPAKQLAAQKESLPPRAGVALSQEKPPLPEIEKHSEAYSIFPVTTALQRKLVRQAPDLFVLMDTTKALKDDKLNWNAIKPRDLGPQLSADLKQGMMKLHFQLFVPKMEPRLPSSTDRNGDVLRLALIGLGHEIGFPKVTSDWTVRNDNFTWKELTASFSGKASSKRPDAESVVGNEVVEVYPVQTNLSRCLTEDSDCVVFILASLKKDKGVIPQRVRNAITDYVTKLKLTRKDKISFHMSRAASDDDVDKLLLELNNLAIALKFKGNSVSLH